MGADMGNAPQEESRPDHGLGPRQDQRQDQSGAITVDDFSSNIIARGADCANRPAELAEMLATLARERENAYLVRAGLIYKGIGDTIRENFAEMIHASEGEAPR